MARLFVKLCWVFALMCIALDYLKSGESSCAVVRWNQENSEQDVFPNITLCSNQLSFIIHQDQKPVCFLGAFFMLICGLGAVS